MFAFGVVGAWHLNCSETVEVDRDGAGCVVEVGDGAGGTVDDMPVRAVSAGECFVVDAGDDPVPDPERSALATSNRVGGHVPGVLA